MGKCISKEEFEYFYLTKDNVEEFLKTFSYFKYKTIEDMKVHRNMLCISYQGRQEYYYFNNYYVFDYGCPDQYSPEEFNDNFIKIE